MAGEDGHRRRFAGGPSDGQSFRVRKKAAFARIGLLPLLPSSISFRLARRTVWFRDCRRDSFL